MKWLGIDEGHHELSHEPDSNEEAYEKLIKINTWYAEQVAYLAKRLSEIPEPGADGSLLDHTSWFGLTNSEKGTPIPQQYSVRCYRQWFGMEDRKGSGLRGRSTQSTFVELL